jgi:orotidine-5'-phosphate decarboxylase
MNSSSEATAPVSEVSDRIIIALDVSSKDEALSLARELKDRVGAFKVGLQLFAAAGPEFVCELVSEGHRVFLDLKFHDIPNTVAHAAVEAARLGVWMMNVHTLGGREMMERTVVAVREACEAEDLERPLIIGVTILTSATTETLGSIGISDNVETEVERLARLAAESGLDGVVASPLEVATVRAAVQTPDFIAVTPGIRPGNATRDDQRRVTTIREAFAMGSDFVVIGRPVLQAKDRAAALEQMIRECE